MARGQRAEATRSRPPPGLGEAANAILSLLRNRHRLRLEAEAGPLGGATEEKEDQALIELSAQKSQPSARKQPMQSEPRLVKVCAQGVEGDG